MENMEMYGAIALVALGALVGILKLIPGDQPGESLLSKIYDKFKKK